MDIDMEPGKDRKSRKSFVIGCVVIPLLLALGAVGLIASVASESTGYTALFVLIEVAILTVLFVRNL